MPKWKADSTRCVSKHYPAHLIQKQSRVFRFGPDRPVAEICREASLLQQRAGIGKPATSLDQVTINDGRTMLDRAMHRLRETMMLELPDALRVLQHREQVLLAPDGDLQAG